MDRFVETEGEVRRLGIKLASRLGSSLEFRPLVQHLRRISQTDCTHILNSSDARNYRRWLIPQIISFAQMNVPATIIVLRIRMVGDRALCRIQLRKEKDRLRKQLLRCGFTAVIGNFEVAYQPKRRGWLFHVHMVAFGEVTQAIAKLKKLYRRRINRAVHPEPVRDALTQLSYVAKFVTYYRFPGSKTPLPLPKTQLQQLARWTSGKKFTDFLLLIGFQRRGFLVALPAFTKLVDEHAAKWRRGDAVRMGANHRGLVKEAERLVLSKVQPNKAPNGEQYCKRQQRDANRLDNVRDENGRERRGGLSRRRHDAVKRSRRESPGATHRSRLR